MRVGFLERPTPISLSREASTHRSGSPTDSPHRRRRKEEEDPDLHIDKIQQEQSFSDYAQQDFSVMTVKPQN
jgi:hypothetical protein